MIAYAIVSILARHVAAVCFPCWCWPLLCIFVAVHFLVLSIAGGGVKYILRRSTIRPIGQVCCRQTSCMHVMEASDTQAV